MEIAFRIPPRIVFGSGLIEKIGAEAAPLGHQALLVTGGAAMRATGALGRARLSLESAGVSAVLFDRVEHDPSLETVDAAVAASRAGGCNLVIGLGGGSALDVAKAAAALADKEGGTRDYLAGARSIGAPGLPFLAVPTTSGTGAEITSNSVLTDRQRNAKSSLRSPHMVARAVLVDPALTLSLSPSLTAHSGMDALTQALECYISRAANPISDALALAAVAHITGHLEAAVANGADLAHRESMALGSLLCGMAFANAGLGAVHGLAHPLGLALGLPHGLVCAILLAPVLEFNLPARRERFERLASLLGAGRGEDVPAVVRSLARRIGIPESFGGIGLTETHLPYILAHCRSGSMRSNPRDMSDDDIRSLLRKLM